MLERVQAQLEAIYGLSSELDVTDFVVGPEVAEALGYTGRAREELLLHEADGELSIALYLAPELLERLSRFEHAPAEQVVDGDLEAYCQLAEGVSHFLYVTRAANEGRHVSLLELEAQAEVDKFASCVLTCWRRGRDFAGELYQRLFHWVSYLPTLKPHEQWRYQKANHLSKTFCGRLLRHVERNRMDDFLSDLRYCYRLGAEAKLRHLATSAH